MLIDKVLACARFFKTILIRPDLEHKANNQSIQTLYTCIRYTESTIIMPYDSVLRMLSNRNILNEYGVETPGI